MHPRHIIYVRSMRWHCKSGRSTHTVVMATRIFAWSSSARVCAAVMSHSDTVSGTGELNATTKG